MTKLAIVGSGPSAFYTALRALKLMPNLSINMFERQCFPYGLVRLGVAPDHPEVKACIERFEELSLSNKFRFFGNVNVGKDISIGNLRTSHDAVLLAYGASDPVKLGIKGEQLRGNFSANEVVSWYNGDPNFQNIGIDLAKSPKVSIMGNGNVALDITRILLKNVNELSSTDMTSSALCLLKKSIANEIDIFGRRGLIESKFTNKELRELLSLENSNLSGVYPASELERATKSRVDKKKISILKNYKPMENDNKWKLQFWKQPIEVVGKNKVEAVVFKDLKTNEFIEHPTDIFITSLGLKPRKLEGMESLGELQPNMQYGGSNVFTVGWAATGSQGIIATSMINANTVAEELANYLQQAETSNQKSMHLQALPLPKNKKIVDWETWKKIDEKELEIGRINGKIREKLVDFHEFLV